MKRTGIILTALLAVFAAVPAQAAEEQDYILGRPMTEEEIEEQKELEPEELTEDPEIDLTLPETDGITASRSSLPSSYDARTSGLITSVKNQKPYGTCWAFSAISVAETSILRHGLSIGGQKATASSLDLSELQLAYFFYHDAEDLLGNTSRDSTSAVKDTYLDQGGNGIFTTFAMASWTGVAEESTAAYENASTSLSLSDSLAYSADVAHMENAYWIKLTDLAAVKTMVKTYGNVSISYYHTDEYYNYDTAAYYQNQKTSTNHAVNIVGWDDNYSKNNFVTKPSSDGAWLVKNNWSSDWGDDGYFWISYEDKSLQGSNAFGYIYDFGSSDNYDYIYQYDGSYGYHRLKVADGGSVANTFTVSGSDYEMLKAVSIALYSTDVNYSIQIYQNPTSEDPTSGTAMLTKAQTGSTSYTGYYTIPLNEEGLVLKKGDTYSVVFTLGSEDGNNIEVFCDESYTNGGWITFSNYTKSGQSFEEVGGKWYDLGLDSAGMELNYSGTSVRIKAFTEETEEAPITKVKMNASSATLYVGKTKTLTASITPIHTTDSKAVTWSSSDSKVASVKDGVVTAKAPGTATITAKAGKKKATCVITVKLATPKLVSAASSDYGKILVKWKAVSGAEKYFVYRKETNGGSWKKIGTVKTLTFTDSVTELKTSYTYTVRAYSAAGTTAAKSAYDKTGVSSSGLPNKVTLVSASSVKKGITVTWKKVNCDGYTIYRRKNGGSWKKLTQVSGKKNVSYTDTNVSYGNSYTYTVRAYWKKNGNYLRGHYESAGVTADRVPGTVSMKKLSSASSGMKITWSSTYGAQGYIVYRKNSSGKWKRIKTITSSCRCYYTDKNVKKGTSYTYTVRTYRKVDGKKVYGGYQKDGLTKKY